MADAQPEAQSVDPRTAPPADPFGRALYDASVFIAICGGLITLIVMTLTVWSVLGRSVFNAPLLGDSEVVEVGIAVAIFSFLPFCQMRGANVIVDFFTTGMTRRGQSWLDAFGALLYTLAAALFAWRLVFGGLDYARYGEKTMVLGLPLWWSFVAIIPAMVWLVLVSAYTTIRHLRAARA